MDFLTIQAQLVQERFVRTSGFLPLHGPNKMFRPGLKQIEQVGPGLAQPMNTPNRIPTWMSENQWIGNN